jgi:hypothetical protein
VLCGEKDVHVLCNIQPLGIIRHANDDNKSHRGINVDHGINVDQHLKPRYKCKYCILYLHLFRGFEC